MAQLGSLRGATHVTQRAWLGQVVAGTRCAPVGESERTERASNSSPASNAISPRINPSRGTQTLTSFTSAESVLNSSALPRSAGALLIRQSLIAAMVGLAVGAFAPAVVGRLQRAEATLSKSPRRAGQLATELWRNGYGLLAFFVCTNVDVLLARHVLDHHDAGIYAAGAILTKTALFLPAFVLVAAFPSMARDDRPRRWVPTFVTVAALGLIGIAATIVLPGVAVTYAGGHQYNQLRPDVWLFVLEGVLFALLQILVYDKTAARSSLAVLLWLTALVIATIALSAVHSPAALVSVVIIGVASTILASIAFALRTTRLIC
jgi:O-antigen/teichoic acid export membrane protein